MDLSHTIYDGLVTYRGLPPPLICDFLSRDKSKEIYSEGTSFQIGRIEMVANTGTYVDAPFHRYEKGKDLAELDLESLVCVDAVVVRARGNSGRAVDGEMVSGLNVRNKAVLIDTGWCRHWATGKYFEGHPYLTRAAAEYLRDAGARIVAIDSYNIDDTEDWSRPVHTALLGAGIPICEHACNFDALPDAGFAFSAAPVKVRGMGTFPVRAFAAIPDAKD